MESSLLVRIGVALGIGLLIGIERERRKGRGPARSPAGVRTFTLTALVGALALAFGGPAVLAVAGGVIGLLVVAAYARGRERERDPGMTTEIALLLTLLLGGVAVEEPSIAAALGVSVAILLAARSRLHRFVKSVVTEDEFHDALILAGAALVVLPLLPDRALGPFDAINPRVLWRLSVLIMALGAAGHVAMRLLGPRYGLPIAGFASGFVSSTATIATMASKAEAQPQLHAPAVAAAVLSSVATIAQLFMVIGVVSPEALRQVALPLGAAGVVSVAYGLVFTLRSGKSAAEGAAMERRAFDPRAALFFTATLAVVMLVSTAMNAWFGEAALVIATSFAGFADTHSAAVSVASVAAAGKVSPEGAAVPILAAFSTNTVSKLIVSRVNGDARFFWQITPGLLLMVLAAWGTVILSHVLG